MKETYKLKYEFELNEIVELVSLIKKPYQFFNENFDNIKGLKEWIISNVNTYFQGKTLLASIILTRIIYLGKESYNDHQSRLFIYQIIKNIDNENIDDVIEDILDDYDDYPDSSLSTTTNIIDRIKIQSDIISVFTLLKGYDLNTRYHEYFSLIAFNENYLQSDGRRLYYPTNGKLLKDDFYIDDYESYLAYLSLLKYYIMMNSELKSYYPMFLSINNRRR